MKRFFALALTLVLCVSLLSVTALADEAASLSITDATLAADAESREVTLYVSLNNNPGVAGLDIDISYDMDKLEKVSFTGSGMDSLGTWVIVSDAVWYYPGDVAYNGQILALTFKVKDGVTGTAEVSVSCTAGNVSGEYVTVGGATGIITIECAHAWEWVETKPATCTEEGLKTGTCTVCGETKTEVIPMIAHTEVWDYDQTYHWHVCSVCNNVTDEKDWHSHQIVGETEATEDKPAYWHYMCKCGHDYYEEKAGEPNHGDIRPLMLLSFTAVLSILAAGAYVFKRKVNF